jgi:cytochrome c peroxidase
LQKSIFTILVLVSSVVGLSHALSGCRKNENPGNLTYTKIEVPDGFPQPRYQFNDNPLSEEGIALGKKLFYDGQLSVDGGHPCSSCHQQIAGFGTFEHDRSHGVFGSHTLRNAPVLFNLAWQDKFHWDGEYSSLYEEAAQPINGHLEMGETFNSIIAKLEKDPEYRNMFRKVFRSAFITPENILKALAQFTGTLVSANSKYDKYKKGTASFSNRELAGYELFQQKCASCHAEPLFTDYSLRNIGLPIDNFLNDYGKFMLTGNRQDSLLFKVPTLRNVYISSNYMHDGRFATLMQCIDHYRTGVQPGNNVDPQVKNGIQMTNAEAADLVLFMRTLTDSSFLQDPRYSKP